MRIRLRAAFVGMVFLVAMLDGCRVGPDYRAPPPPAGTDRPWVTRSDAVDTTLAPQDAWWDLYNDSKLNDLQQEALAANNDLKVAEANVSAAQALLSAARAGRYPDTRISLGGTYGRDATTDEILGIAGHPPTQTWLLHDLFTASYEIDLFGRVRRSIEASRADTEASLATRDSVQIVIVAETARAYASVCTYGEELAVARHSLDIVTHEADITERRHGAGANSDFDVVRAQGLVAQVQALLPPLEGLRRSALFQLAALLGRTPVNAPWEVESCESAPVLTALIPVGDGDALLRRRPDIRQAERRLAAATARIGVATADLYPIVSINGLYGGVGAELSALTADRGLTWGIGPSLSWVFPNQAVQRARIRQAKAGATGALASFDSVVLTALKECEQSLSIYESALRRRAALHEAQSKAQSAFAMASEQFAAGSLSVLELLTTEQTLVTADEAVAQSDAALVQDQIAVFKAFGGGWQTKPFTTAMAR